MCRRIRRYVYVIVTNPEHSVVLMCNTTNPNRDKWDLLGTKLDGTTPMKLAPIELIKKETGLELRKKDFRHFLHLHCSMYQEDFWVVEVPDLQIINAQLPNPFREVSPVDIPDKVVQNLDWIIPLGVDDDKLSVTARLTLEPTP